MDEIGAVILLILFCAAVSFFVSYYYKKIDSQTDSNTNKKNESNSEVENENNIKEQTENSLDLNYKKKDNSQEDKIDFKSFLKYCDEIIDKIDNYPISAETRKELELCYSWSGKKINEIPFSIIIQNDIIRCLYKCRYYTACLNQQRNKPVYEYFYKDFPKECVSHLVIRIVTDAIVSDKENENYEDIDLNDVLRSIIFLLHLVRDLVNTDISSPLIKKNDFVSSTSWVIEVISYMSKIQKPFFKYGDFPAEQFEYSNFSNCILDLIKVTAMLNPEEEPTVSTTLKTEHSVEKNNCKKANENNNLNILLNELNSLIGLVKVKEVVNGLINYVAFSKKREAHGLKPVPLSLHLVFSGNPGTGKTTVARILAKIYKEIGVLSQGQLIETDRSGLVAGYVGQTALKTQEVIEQAKGGILFIDEAYSLASSRDSNDFGKEAIDTLLKAMEDMRDDFIVIVAGYPDLMKQFLKSNPGLESRFNTFIDFEDYQPTDLVEIFKHMCKEKDCIISEKLSSSLIEYFNNLYLNRDDSYANARTVRNVFENAIKKQANRVAGIRNPSKQDLQELIYEDLF